jgi:hypothetical protein
MRYELDGRPITFYLTRGITMQEPEYRVGDRVEIRLDGVVNYVNSDGTPDVTVTGAPSLYADADPEGDTDVQNVPLAAVTLKRRALKAGQTITRQDEYDDAPIGTVVRSFSHDLVRVASGWIDPQHPTDVLRQLNMPRRVLYVPGS